MSEEGFLIRSTRDEPRLLTLYAHPRGEEIARIEADGTVRVFKEGAEPEAARMLWGAIEREGKALYTRIAELEAQNKALQDQLTATQRELEQARQNLTEHARLHAELNAILHPNGDGPKKPSLCDLVAYVRKDLTEADGRIDTLLQQLAAREVELTGIKEANSQLAGAAVERPPYKADLLAELARVRGKLAEWRGWATPVVSNDHYTVMTCVKEMEKILSPVVPPCKGANCGSTDGLAHSEECQAEHNRAALTPPEQEKNDD